MSKMKIGIVGLGWLGLELAKAFQKSGHSVWGTVRSAEKAKEISKSNILAFTWQFPDAPDSDILHFAQETELLILTLPPSTFANHGLNTYSEVLNEWVERFPVKTKIIFTSSIGVYSEDNVDAKEDSILKVDHPVVLAENLLLKNASGRVTILRLAGLIGEDRNPVHFLVKKGQNDAPSKPVNLIHRLDIIKVIELIVLKDFFGEILNVVHPDHPTRKEYYSKMAKQLNLPVPQFTQKEEKVTCKIVNCNKLVSHLGYYQFVEL